ncbi:hypothetical protein [Leucobacter luti]|uniref:hypothetical protein n=1 Tax=Leucobacter luti TaxID=340320 RepID=UPI00102B5E35|nr:hypothetical protein [Leucobacter luti]
MAFVALFPELFRACVRACVRARVRTRKKVFLKKVPQMPQSPNNRGIMRISCGKNEIKVPQEMPQIQAQNPE